MDNPRLDDIAKVRAMVATSDPARLDEILASLHPADIAEILEELDEATQVAVLKGLDNEIASEVLTQIDEHSGQTLLLLLTDHEVVSLLEEMPSDDAADIMSAMPQEKSARIEALLDSEDRDQIQELREFAEDTAGGIMEAECVSVPQDATFADAIALVRASAEEIENIQKIFVVDESDVLTGQIGVLELLLRPPDTPVRDAMETNVITVPVEMDQEEVASMFGKYDQFTLPVVGPGGVLVGRITVDDIIDVIEEEVSEDIAHIAGTTEAELGQPSVFKVSRKRLPWLVTGLVGQMVAALLMSQFELSLSEFVVLTFFVPLIVGTAGAIGIQAAVVVVRELALGQIDVLHLGRRVWKEIQVAVINGVILGVVLFSAVVAWRHDVELGGLLWTSLMLVIMAAAIVGSSGPLLLQRWGADPAIATGPFIAVLNDIIGLTIYLSLATAYLS